MTANDSLIKDKDKLSDFTRNYSFCDICEFNGYPNEKVVYHYEGLRSEEEEGFITIFTVYDYSIQRGKLHVHKHNEKLICEFVKLEIGEEIGVKTSQ